MEKPFVTRYYKQVQGNILSTFEESSKRYTTYYIDGTYQNFEDTNIENWENYFKLIPICKAEFDTLFKEQRS